MSTANPPPENRRNSLPTGNTPPVGTETEPKTTAAPVASPAPADLGGRIGKYMIIGFWLLLLFLAYLWASRHLELMHNPNPSPQTVSAEGQTSVQLLMNRYGHYVAGGTINGTPVTFLLDTGATSVSLSSSLASRMGLKPGNPVRLITANGTVTGYTVSLASVAIGELVRNNVRAHINPGLSSDEVLLGMSYLRHFKLTQQGNMLTIEKYP